jgi:hypothetical protein
MGAVDSAGLRRLALPALIAWLAGASGDAVAAAGDAPKPSPIPPERATVWDPGIPGGVPAVTKVHATIDAGRYGAGEADATEAINAAIRSAGDEAERTGVRQAVFLPRGTYLAAGILRMNRSDVVLRGAGPGLTRVVSGAARAIDFGRIWPVYGEAMNVLADAPKGSRTLTLSNADGARVRVGDILQLDQEDGPGAPRGPVFLHGGVIWLADGHYHKRQPATDTNGPGTRGRPWRRAGGGWDRVAADNAQITGPWRSTCQQVEVASITPGKKTTVLVLSGPLHIDFRASRAPQVFHTATRDTPPRPMPGVAYAGIEDLTVTGAGGPAINGWNLAYCWIRNVEVDGQAVAGDPAHPGVAGPLVSLTHAYRSVVRDSYVHHSRRMVQNAGSYGVVLTQSSECLVENNIAVWLCKPIMLNVSGGGNVIGYNHVDQAVIVGSDWQESAIDGCHQAFCHSDLFEGNQAPNLGSDSTHGNSGGSVWFRNFATGRNSVPYDLGRGEIGLPAGNLRAAGADAWSREHTFVGNVLHAVDGGRGTTYELTGASHGSRAAPVFRLGDNGGGGRGGTWDDGMAAQFTYRHGNWDNVTKGQRWEPGNPVRELPPSLYLTARPAFFGDLPWPWVEPSGTPRTLSLPARLRYEAVMTGKAGGP